MTIRALFARFRTADTGPVPAGNAPTRTRTAAAGDQIEPRAAWRPTARSAYGRYIQATRHRQTAIEAIHQRGIERGIDPKDVLAAYDRLDAGLRARGWHPDQFDHGFDDDAPIDDFMNRTDVDYDPRMAAYDARTAQQGHTDGDEA